MCVCSVGWFKLSISVRHSSANDARECFNHLSVLGSHQPRSPEGGSIRDRVRINRIHGAAWKALISTYMVAIPLSGDICTAEQNISAGLLPDIPVSTAIAAKTGEAINANPSTMLIAAAF